MAKFEPVNPEDIPEVRDARRGRVYYPLIKSFLESNHVCVKLNRNEFNRSTMSLSAGIGQYARKHELPVKTFQRKGEVYLLRLDLDDEGNTIPDWKVQHYPNGDDNEGTPEDITPQVVGKKTARKSKAAQKNK